MTGQGERDVILGHVNCECCWPPRGDAECCWHTSLAFRDRAGSEVNLGTIGILTVKVDESGEIPKGEKED